MPYTENSRLARNAKKRLSKLNDIGKIKVEIVKCAGEKIVDLLHKSKPREDMDCHREKFNVQNCLDGRGEKLGDCKKRCVVYEIHCEECGELEAPIIEGDIKKRGKVGNVKKKSYNQAGAELSQAQSN